MLFARTTFIDLLQNREYSLHDRLVNVLSASAEIQYALDEEDTEEIKAIAQELSHPEIIAERVESLKRLCLKSLWKMPKICFCILNVLTL